MRIRMEMGVQYLSECWSLESGFNKGGVFRIVHLWMCCPLERTECECLNISMSVVLQDIVVIVSKNIRRPKYTKVSILVSKIYILNFSDRAKTFLWAFNLLNTEITNDKNVRAKVTSFLRINILQQDPNLVSLFLETGPPDIFSLKKKFTSYACFVTQLIFLGEVQIIP